MNAKENCWLSKGLVLLSLLVLLFVQAGMLVDQGKKKMGYHEDEIYTYKLANDQNAYQSQIQRFKNEWKEGSYYADVLIPDGEEKFSFGVVYQNQAADTHPPLYYLLINFLSSFCENEFNHWTGLSINIVCSLLTTLVIYLIFRILNVDHWLGITAATAWAMSIGSITMTMFIRMYTLKTLLCTLLVYFHLKAFYALKQEVCLRKSYLAAMFFNTVSAILTHYYSLVFCFFVCGLSTIILIVCREWRNLLKYVLVELGAVAASLIIFRPMYTHLFESYRGQGSFSTLTSGVVEHITKLNVVWKIISDDLACGGLGKLLTVSILGLFVGGIAYVIRHADLRKLQRRKGGFMIRMDVRFSSRFSEMGMLEIIIYALFLLISVSYIVLVSKVAPFQTDRYYACVYPLLTSALTGLMYKLIMMLSRRKIASGVVAVCVALLLFAGFQSKPIDYLYPRYALRIQKLEHYHGKSAIVINGKSYNSAPEKWMTEFMNYDAVYVCRSREYDNLQDAVATRDLSDGFLLYAYEMKDFTEEKLVQELEKYMTLETFELVTDVDCPVYFCRIKTV